MNFHTCEGDAFDATHECSCDIGDDHPARAHRAAIRDRSGSPTLNRESGGFTVRDQWGETAEERADRIMTRDLARTVFVEEATRDGVPPDGGALVAFNAGYAAGRADQIAREAGGSR